MSFYLYSSSNSTDNKLKISSSTDSKIYYHSGILSSFDPPTVITGIYTYTGQENLFIITSNLVSSYQNNHEAFLYKEEKITLKSKILNLWNQFKSYVKR